MKNDLRVGLDGTKYWYKDDKLHRAGGPAVEESDGYKEWWVDGELLGKDDSGFWALWDLLTDEQRNNINLLMHLPQ